jgi:LmbE family N-acetylglucosaminyl deacetylase
VLTGHASLDNAVRALRDQAKEFLEKSEPPDELLASVSRLVAKGRAARLAARQAVLAIGAHPDDVEIGAAGALLAHRGMGHDVSILTLTRGARGGADATRAGESEMAARALGATLFLEDLPDTGISEGDPTIAAICRVVESVRPTVVYTHSLHDVHQDHRNTHRAAMVAVRKVGRVYCFQSPSATIDFRPTRFVAIDDQLEGKQRAIEAFASQVEIRPYLERDLIESTARYWSRFGDGRYAEAFEVIREAAATGQRGAPGSGAAAAAPDAGTAVGPPGDAATAVGPPGVAGPAQSADATQARPEVPHAAR